jgi:hypothetical protein
LLLLWYGFIGAADFSGMWDFRMIDLWARPVRHPWSKVGAIFILALCQGAQAQTAGDVIPNFSPTADTSWYFDRPDGDNYLPPESGASPVVSPPDYPYRPNAEVDGAAGDPTYRIADTSNPILQPWVVEQLERTNDEVRAGRIPFTARQRCFPPGVPAWNIFRRVGAGPMLFLTQTPGEVTMIWRGDNQVRHVYLDVPHSANPTPSWHGESVGHYEGDTLVVDTIALLEHPQSFVDNYRTPHTGQLHVIERFRLVGGDTIEVDIYVEDPGAFTVPWNARQIMSRADDHGPLVEWRCSEGNPNYFSLYEVPVPFDDTPDF